MADTLDMDESKEEKEQPSAQYVHQNLLLQGVAVLMERFERVCGVVECVE